MNAISSGERRQRRHTRLVRALARWFRALRRAGVEAFVLFHVVWSWTALDHWLDPTPYPAGYPLRGGEPWEQALFWSGLFLLWRLVYLLGSAVPRRRPLPPTPRRRTSVSKRRARRRHA